MRRRAILVGIAGTAAAALAQQLQVLARPLPDTTGDTSPPPPPTEHPPADDPPAAPVVPAAPAAPPAAPVAPAAPAKPAATKPDLNDPKYSPNAYPPLKKVLDGPPKSGEF